MPPSSSPSGPAPLCRPERRRGSGLVRWLLVAAALTAGGKGAAQEPPPWLPHYDLDIQIAADCQQVQVRQQVAWVNRHARPAQELVFNVFAADKLPREDRLFEAKMLELLRIAPREGLDYRGHALELQRVLLLEGDATRPLQFSFQEKNPTALVVPLPHPVAQGQLVRVVLEFCLKLPNKQGHWGRWNGVLTLSDWYPVLAYYDEDGWQPTPFVRWHPAVFHEAGLYRAAVTLPRELQLACTGSVQACTDAGPGLRRVEFAPRVARTYLLVAGARFREFRGEGQGVPVRCLAFPEHEQHARVMLRTAEAALAAYQEWFGPYPYTELTIVEAYPGWRGGVGAGVLLMDERLFGLPGVAAGMVEVVVAQQTARQWWHNVVGSNGYAETWIDEGLACYFGHRFLDRWAGRDNPLFRWPKGLGWLPQVNRETFRHGDLYGTLGRGEAGPTVQAIPAFEHSANLSALACDRGSKVVGMLEARLGEPAFLAFCRRVYARYCFRVLRVADLQRELTAFTGESWDEFFRNWLYGAGMADWAVEQVRLEKTPAGAPGRCKATVLIRQQGDCNEPTFVGFRLDDDRTYPLRVPVRPCAAVTESSDPPARVTRLGEGAFRVEAWLPAEPKQVAVDPDQLLLDREPTNNFWKPEVRCRLTPLYTLLEETDLTCAYDRWNLIVGPWLSDAAYNDPWFAYSQIAGFRLGAYRTQHFVGGLYAGYRTNFNDLAAGADALWDHWPWPRTQLGFNAEKSLVTLGDQGPGADRAIVYGRYVIEESDSLYQQPMHFAQLFASTTNNLLPQPRVPIPGAEHFTRQNALGVQYHLNTLTPYWDPEMGFQVDATYAGGPAVWGQPFATQQFSAQLSAARAPPEGLGWFSDTRLAARLYGAAALPGRAGLFSLGGSELFRGFDLAQRQGSLVWIGSVEWRLPLVRDVCWDVCDHAAGLRRAYLAALYDVGNAYAAGRAGGPVAHAVGAGLRLDVAWFSFFERSTLRLDLAKTVNAGTPVQFWFGVEHPF